jgi:hypothetical protein
MVIYSISSSQQEGSQGTSLATSFQMPHSDLSSRINDKYSARDIAAFLRPCVWQRGGRRPPQDHPCLSGKATVVTFNSFYLHPVTIRWSFKPSPKRGSFLCTVINAIQRQLIR